MELNYNRVELRGTVDDVPALSHVNHGCAFYRFTLSVLRLSGQADKLPVIVPKSLLLLTPLTPGDTVHITGQLRSFNNKSGEGAKLVITVFAKELYLCDDDDLNEVRLIGTLCKKPNLRMTPMGRDICDLMLAVNRRYGRSDYLPCITWGLKAREAAGGGTGTMVTLEGRIQSRNYIKIVGGDPVEKTAFEVSVTDIVEFT